MALFNFRDSWNVWRRKVDEALGTVEPIPASNVILDGSDVSVNSAIQQLISADENLENQVTGLNENNFTNGAVNLFPITATTQTISGITFTVNNDGTITANGTSTAEISFSLYGGVGNRLFDTGVLQKGKSYKISGTPPEMPTSVYMYLNTSDEATQDHGNGAILNSTASTTGGNFAIAINTAGITLDNIVFKPMITVADMPNSDYEHYVPYAMSNRELTSMFKSDTAPLTNFIAQISKVGNVKVLYLDKPKTAMTYNVEYEAGTLTDDFKPSGNQIFYTKFVFNSRDYAVFIGVLGDVKIICLTDSLPTDGIPTLRGFITFI